MLDRALDDDVVDIAPVARASAVEGSSATRARAMSFLTRLARRARAETASMASEAPRGTSSTLPRTYDAAIEDGDARARARTCDERARGLGRETADVFVEACARAGRHALEGATRGAENVAELTAMLASAQEGLAREVEEARGALERELSGARASASGGADKAKRAVRACLERCDALRMNAIPRIKELAARASAEEAQVSRKFLTEWTALDEACRETFTRMVDFDRYVAQEATRVDVVPLALCALVEEVLGSSGGMISQEERAKILETFETECVMAMARRISVLPKSASPHEKVGANPMRNANMSPTSASPPPVAAVPSPQKAPGRVASDSIRRAERERTAKELASQLKGFFASRIVDDHDLDRELDEVVDDFLRDDAR